MKKRKIPKPSYQDLNFDAMKWCIDNDFQVYVKPITKIKTDNVEDPNTGELIKVEYYIETGKYHIVVRRKGITTEGKDYKKINGRYIKSTEKFSELVFNSQKEAFDKLNYVYERIRKNYG